MEAVERGWGKEGEGLGASEYQVNVFVRIWGEGSEWVRGRGRARGTFVH